MMNIWNYENIIVNEHYDEHNNSSASFVYPNESTLFEDVEAVATSASNNWSRAIEGKH